VVCVRNNKGLPYFVEGIAHALILATCEHIPLLTSLYYQVPTKPSQWR
jgi:hypothetical protein